MFSFIKNWFYEIKTKVVKTTYGDGDEVYKGYLQPHRGASWEQVEEIFHNKEGMFPTLESVNKSIERWANRIKRNRVSKVEVYRGTVK